MTDEFYMRKALAEAIIAKGSGEVPVGAVIVSNDVIIARGHNQTELLQDCTAHAEMIALTAAFDSSGSKYLPDATLYVTVEPCLMCCGALYWSKIGRIVYGASDEKKGYGRYFKENLLAAKKVFHPKTIVVKGILENECAQLIKNFFLERR